MGVLRPWAAGVAWPLTLRPAAQEGTPLGLRRLQADLASIPWTLCVTGESSPWSAVSWGHPAHIRLPFAITDGEAVVRSRAWAQGPWRSAVSGRLKKARSRWVRHRRAAACLFSKLVQGSDRRIGVNQPQPPNRPRSPRDELRAPAPRIRARFGPSGGLQGVASPRMFVPG